MHDNLRRLWFDLWHNIKAQGNPNNVFNDLILRYSEPHRTYHTLFHIEHCFNEFSYVQTFANNPEAIAFALWYHDAVYNPMASDNEEKSMALAQEVAKNALLPESFIQLVINHISATKHNVIITNFDTQLLVDIDLAILGQSKKKFDQYEQQIRKEYDWVSENDFITGRVAILKSFRLRSNIYNTKYFRFKYEAQARRNISRSIKRLTDRP